MAKIFVFHQFTIPANFNGDGLLNGSVPRTNIPTNDLKIIYNYVNQNSGFNQLGLSVYRRPLQWDYRNTSSSETANDLIRETFLAVAEKKEISNGDSPA